MFAMMQNTILYSLMGFTLQYAYVTSLKSKIMSDLEFL